jgi:dihydrofolate reductase
VRRVLVQAYITVDGCTSKPEFPGSDADEEGSEVDAWVGRYDSIDTLILGRKAYEDWAKFWPASVRKPSDPEFFHQHSRFTDRVQKIVFSRTLTTAAWANTRIERRDVGDVVAELKQQPGKDISVGGGATITRELMKRNLVDDYLLTVWPVVAGRGPKLFGDLPTQLNLKLLKSTTERSGVVLLHYQAIRSD